MSVFLVLIHYDAPAEEVAKLRPVHREFLQRHYATGRFVCSGPRVDGVGGVLLSRGASADEVAAVLREDPYALQGLAHHEVIEFNVVSHDPRFAAFLTPWRE